MRTKIGAALSRVWLVVCLAWICSPGPAAAAYRDSALVALVQGDDAGALALIRPLAESGAAAAEADLALAYRSGWGVPQSFEKAVEWYRKAADQGLPGAQVMMGLSYALGQGVPLDRQEAVRWYFKADDIPEARYLLARAYLDGDGVPVDARLGAAWMELAAGARQPQALAWMSAPDRPVRARSFWGATAQNVTPEIVESLGAPGLQGALIASVEANGPFERAGVRQGDLILAVDGHVVHNGLDFLALHFATAPGETIHFDVWREGRRISIDKILETSAPEQPADERGDAAKPNSGKRLLSTEGAACSEVLGMSVGVLDSASAASPDGPGSGLLILGVRAGLDAANKGLRANDVILTAGAKPARSCSDVEAAVANARLARRGSVLLGAWRNGVALFVPLRLDAAVASAPGALITTPAASAAQASASPTGAPNGAPPPSWSQCSTLWANPMRPDLAPTLDPCRTVLTQQTRGADLSAYLVNMALFEKWHGDPRGALRDLDHALALDPKSMEGLADRAAVQDDLGHFDLARADRQAVARLQPRDAEGFISLATAEDFLGHREAALAAYTAAIDRAPRIAKSAFDAVYQRGRVYAELGRFDLAERDFTTAIAMAPDQYQAPLERCRARIAIGRDLDLGLADCINAERVAAQHKTKVPLAEELRAVIDFRKRRFEDAIHDCDAEILARPLEGSPYYLRGLAKILQGKSDGKADLALAEAINPKVAELFAALGVKP